MALTTLRGGSAVVAELRVYQVLVVEVAIPAAAVPIRETEKVEVAAGPGQRLHGHQSQRQIWEWDMSRYLNSQTVVHL